MVTSTTPRKGTETFRPRARLVSVLGEQLIRDATIGLLELVKNGYDADADNVYVKLLNLANPAETTIIVEDDGYGMDFDTILYKWLEPATGHKEADKQRGQHTPKGRLPLGEKGVGRFAAHKLGRQLTLVSRARNEQGILSDTEVVIEIDWDRFDADTYLSDIRVNYEERQPQHFVQGSGTFMEMRRARTVWQERNVERVSNALRRLMSPFRTPNSFSVKLACPEYPKYQELDPGEILKTAHARMTVLIDEKGIAEYEYTFKLDPYPSRVVEPRTVDLRKNNKDWQPVDRKSKCGSFSVTLYIWDRDPTILKLSGITKLDELNQINGISVFRDGIRVMPYGEPDDDWLGIDKARYMSTSEAFSRKNVVGAIEIDQVNNPNLRDKSNREGFIENEAFADLYDLLQVVMRIAYNEFGDDRRKIRELQKAAKREMIPAVAQLEEGVKKVTHALAETRRMAQGFVTQGKIAPEVAEQMLATFNQTSQTLESAAVETRQAAADTLTTFDEEREILLALAGFGLAAERFTHEFARLTREANELLLKVKNKAIVRNWDEVIKLIDTLQATLEALKDLVLALGPMFYIRRKTREKVLDVKTIVGHALLLNEGDIRYYKIKVEIDEQEKLNVTMREGALTQVFNNLIDNQ